MSNLTQQAVTTTIAYAAESTYGVSALPANGKALRRVSSTIATAKDTFKSAEVRPDQMVSDMRHGLHKVGGTVACELSTQSYDDLLAALLRGTWTAGVTASQTDFTSVTASASAGTFTNGSGSWITKGFKPGDVVRFAGLTQAGNNAKNFRILSLTASDLSVYPPPLDMTAESNFTVAVVGQKLLVGQAQPSFTIEQNYPDIDVSEVFTGMRVDKGQFKLPVNGMATVDFDFIGQDGKVLNGGAAPYFTSPTAAPTTGILAGPSGSIEVGGISQGVITACDFMVSHSCVAPAVVGSVISPNVYYGRTEITGTISAYLQDASLVNAFLAETEVDIVVQLDAAPPAGGGPSEFLCFGFHRVKFTGATKTIAGDNGVIVTLPFESLLANAANSDASSMVIQRSNA